MRYLLAALFLLFLGSAAAANIPVFFSYDNPHVQSPLPFAKGQLCLVLQTGDAKGNTRQVVQTDKNGMAFVNTGAGQTSIPLVEAIGCAVWQEQNVYYICSLGSLMPILENNSKINLGNCIEGRGPICPASECTN